MSNETQAIWSLKVFEILRSLPGEVVFNVFFVFLLYGFIVFNVSKAEEVKPPSVTCDERRRAIEPVTLIKMHIIRPGKTVREQIEIPVVKKAADDAILIELKQGKLAWLTVIDGSRAPLALSWEPPVQAPYNICIDIVDNKKNKKNE